MSRARYAPRFGPRNVTDATQLASHWHHIINLGCDQKHGLARAREGSGSIRTILTSLLVGDVTCCVEGPNHRAILVQMLNQRDQETVTATASIALPSREGGLLGLPPVPVELERKALRFLARHWTVNGSKA